MVNIIGKYPIASAESRKVTSQPSQFPRFYVTAPSLCPYLDGKMERKVFTELNAVNPKGLHESMAKIGFRRSQDIVYRPNCESCSECKSVRIPVASFSPGRTQRRLIRLNNDLTIKKLPNIATEEHYHLLHRYLARRHSGGGMANMTYDEYVSMIECSPVNSCLFEYRLADELLAVILTDIMEDGLSMVYSFFDVRGIFSKRSLGTYIILDHIARARLMDLKYIYLGYYIEGSPKMAYKKNFHPLEILDGNGWLVTEKP